jgi:hypothetical protein
MNGYQQEPPQAGCKKTIERNIPGHKRKTGNDAIPETIHFIPDGQILFCELGIGCHSVIQKVIVHDAGLPHHVPYVFKKMRAMGILFGITVYVMHTMHNCISPWHQVGRPLGKPGQEIKYFLAFGSGGIHLMRPIPVKKKGVKK